MIKYPELTDRLILPIRTAGAPHGWAYQPTSQDLLEDFIFKDKNKALTFMSLEFSRLRIIDDPRIMAQVCLNTDDRSFEMHINIKKIKSLWWEGRLQRVLRRPLGFKMPDLDEAYLPEDFAKLTVEKQEKARLVAKGKITETDRFWANSLVDVSRTVPPIFGFACVQDARKIFKKTIEDIITHEFGHLWFWHLHHKSKDCPAEAHMALNIATDGLVNYHLNIDDGKLSLHHRKPLDMYLAVIPILFCRINLPFYKFRDMSHEDFYVQFKNPLLEEQEYLAWRVLRSQIHHFKRWSIATIIEKVEAVRQKIIKYESTITELAIEIRSLFPDAAKSEDLLGLSCQDEEENPKSNFIPVKNLPPTETPPGFADLLENLIPELGMGGDMTSRSLAELKAVKANHKILRSFAAYAEKDPSRFVIKNMKTEVFNRSQPTYRPNKYPVRKLMAASNALTTSAPPRFYPRMTAEEKKAGNTLDIYIDVSGSFNAMTPRVMGFIRNLKTEFTVRTWQFSDSIVELSDEDLREGYYNSSGGTSGAAILKHIRSRAEIVSNFICLGDRAYGPYPTDVSFPRPITILDVVLKRKGNPDPWFQPGKNVAVWSMTVNKDFEIQDERKEVCATSR